MEVDSKAEALLSNLSLIFEHDPEAKVLIFTEFRETQRYLAGRSRPGDGTSICSTASSSRWRRTALWSGSATSAGPQVLISPKPAGRAATSSSATSWSTTTCPWNPMRVEQRIGRVDRIGQDHVVQIFNFWVKGTIEERVLNVLERRINVFEDTVGGLDPILGGTEKDLRKILRLAEADRDRLLTASRNTWSSEVKAAREAERQLRDFIMDTKSFSREIAERITGRLSPVTADDQERFITALLADVRTHISQEQPGEWQLDLS